MATATAAVTISSSSNTRDTPTIHFDQKYVKTLDGILKIAECVTSLIGFICVQTIPMSAYKSAGGWYSFVSMSAFWLSLFLFVMYIFHIVERLTWFPWLLVETVFTCVWTVFFFIAGCVATVYGKEDPGWGAAAFFAFLVMFIFGFDAFRKYKAWRGGEVAQGARSQVSETNNAGGPTPSYPTY